MILRKYVKRDTDYIRNLYLSAFPADERAPFFMIASRAKKGLADMLVAYDKGEFTGFAYVVRHDDYVYLFYLAVDENKRGMGYGKRIINGVKHIYKGYRIFLAREQMDKSAENYQQRIGRREFYIRCGFEDLPCCIKEGNVIYDVMSIGGEKIYPSEYGKLMSLWAGRFLRKSVDMKMIKKERKI